MTAAASRCCPSQPAASAAFSTKVATSEGLLTVERRLLALPSVPRQGRLVSRASRAGCAWRWLWRRPHKPPPSPPLRVDPRPWRPLWRPSSRSREDVPVERPPEASEASWMSLDRALAMVFEATAAAKSGKRVREPSSHHRSAAYWHRTLELTRTPGWA